MSRGRFLRRAAFTAAVGGVLYAATKGNPSEPLPHSGPSSSSSPSTTAAAATGHLALVRAHPELRDLNALLTPRSFLVDSTRALLASALRCAPHSPADLRQRRDVVSGQILSAEAKGAARAANHGRLQLALRDARDGSLEDALGACARVAAEEPNNAVARLNAAVLCHVLGRSEEEARWVQGVPGLTSPLSPAVKRLVSFVVREATMGCAPRAACSDKLVLATMLGLVEMSMWSMFNDGDLTERLQVLALMLFLRRLAAGNSGNAAELVNYFEKATPGEN